MTVFEAKKPSSESLMPSPDWGGKAITWYLHFTGFAGSSLKYEEVKQ